MKIQLENFDVAYMELKNDLYKAIQELVEKEQEKTINVNGWVGQEPLLNVHLTNDRLMGKVEIPNVCGNDYSRTFADVHLGDITIDDLLNIYRNIVLQ